MALFDRSVEKATGNRMRERGLTLSKGSQVRS